MFKKLIMFVLIGMAINAEVMAVTSLKVYAKNEAIAESNIIKPRFYIQNTGDEVITNFTCKYNFTLTEMKTPIIDDYYTPNTTISLESHGGSSYTIVYTFSGVELEPDAKLPDVCGNVVGLHYADWSNISMTNALPYNFEENGNVVLFNENGAVIGDGNNGAPVIIVPENVYIIDEDGDGKEFVTINTSQSYDPEGFALTYKWWEGVGYVSTESHFNVELSTMDGAYQLELQVTDVDGNVSVVHVNVYVLDKQETVYDLEVYTKSIDIDSDNISRVRSYIVNNGYSELKDFKIRYYFSMEEGTSPVGEFWYTPNSTGSIQSIGENLYCIELDYTGQALISGMTLPNSDGNVFAYHLSNWGTIYVDDDFSYSHSDEFVLNENVAVFDKDNNLIYGHTPISEVVELPNQYNLSVVNPVVHGVMIPFTHTETNSYDNYLYIYDNAGQLYHKFYFSNYLYINPAVFSKGETYTAELVVDGVVDGRVSFYVPLL